MRGRFNKLSVVLAGVLSAALVLGGCAKKADDSNTFKVGMECAYAPFNWTQNNDTGGGVAIEGGGYAGGYDVEIAKLIAESLGKELVIVKTEWDGLPPGITSGKIDAIIAGMSPTPDRKMTLDFTDKYYTSDLVVVVKKDGPFAQASNIQDFTGAKLTAQLNTLHYDVIDQIDGVAKQTAMEDFPTMVVALSSGKIDGYVSERPGALSAIATNPDLTYIPFEGAEGFVYDGDSVDVAVGVKKGSELTEGINKALAGISEEKRLELMEKAVQNQPSAE